MIEPRGQKAWFIPGIIIFIVQRHLQWIKIPEIPKKVLLCGESLRLIFMLT